MEYQKVPHSHIVPAGYLRAWSHGGRIAMCRVGHAQSKLISVRDAGVRKNFYRRERPSGETTYDIEWSLGEAEKVALPLIPKLPDLWPLGDEDKAKVGQFFALQHLRGPAFKAWHAEFIEPHVDELRADPAADATPPPGMTAEDAIDRAAEHLQSDTYRSTRMLKLVRSVGIVLSSMHWSLVEFSKATLLTSDHPVVMWPLNRDRVRLRPNDLGAGVIDTLEVFAPIGPSHLLLMSWLNDVDVSDLVPGQGRHAATANAFVLANAGTQWFHEPDTTPWVAKGARTPLSPDLVPGYGAGVGASSPRRQKTRELANAEVAAPLSNDPVSIVTVSRQAAH